MVNKAISFYSVLLEFFLFFQHLKTMFDLVLKSCATLDLVVLNKIYYQCYFIQGG